jgi:MOSC domain-containing protein YiiM
MKFNTKEIGRIKAVSTSDTKGVKKVNKSSAYLVENYGLTGDAHAGKWHRQVSLLADESIEKMRYKGIDVTAGDFAENITTEGLQLWSLPVDYRFKLGEDTLLEITQIGKKCHQGCAIFQQIGECVMPKEGIFARVLKGGTIRPDDPILTVPTDQ